MSGAGRREDERVPVAAADRRDGQQRSRGQPQTASPRRRGRAWRARRRVAIAPFRIPLQPLQVGAQIGRLCVAQRPIFFERLQNDLVEPGRQLGTQRRGRRWLLMKDRRRDDRRGRAGKGRTPGGHLEEDEPEREEIGARVDLVAAQLLRRHVGERADGRPFGGQHRPCGVRLGDGVRASDRRRRLGDAEVEQLRAPCGQEDVRRFDVAMDDPGAVRGSERVGERKRRLEQGRESSSGPLRSRTSSVSPWRNSMTMNAWCSGVSPTS